MGVDEPRQHDRLRGVDDPGVGPGLEIAPDRGDASAVDQDVGIGQLRAGRIAGDDMAALDEKLCHAAQTRFLVVARSNLTNEVIQSTTSA